MEQREPTGAVAEGPDGPELVIHRMLPHPIDDVWAWLTEPELLGRWYGTWTGDPSSGIVELTMLEAPDHLGTCRIIRCEPPTQLAVSLIDPEDQAWDLQVTLEQSGEGTRLTFRQPLGDFVLTVGDIGPGWEYDLDRRRHHPLHRPTLRPPPHRTRGQRVALRKDRRPKHGGGGRGVRLHAPVLLGPLRRRL